ILWRAAEGEANLAMQLARGDPARPGQILHAIPGSLGQPFPLPSRYHEPCHNPRHNRSVKQVLLETRAPRDRSFKNLAAILIVTSTPSWKGAGEFFLALRILIAGVSEESSTPAQGPGSGFASGVPADFPPLPAE